MVVPDSPRRVAYERALRIIGRHLDAEPAYHASVVEDQNGFTVRSQPVRHRAAARVVYFDWPRVEDLNVLNAAAREISHTRRRYSGMWSAFPTGHEDFFRALGNKFDQMDADNVSIDELPSGLSISFMRPTGDEGAFEKCHLVYGREDVEALLREAQSRRGQGTKRASA